MKLPLALLVMAQAATAQELAPSFMLEQGAIICDTKQQIIEYIDSKGMPIEGCGITQWAIVAQIFNEPNHDAHGKTYNIVMFVFARNNHDTGEIEPWIQYGFWGPPKTAKTVEQDA